MRIFKFNFKNTCISALLAGALVPGIANAINYESTDFAMTPLSLTSDNTPLVMIAMSLDHQLYYKAYSDYTDLTGDGIIETGYIDHIPGFEYNGYFDPNVCYSYNTSLKHFVPEKASVVRGNSSDSDSVKIQHSCDGDHWSGNFLNWATMTRLDMVRSVLYGGYRSTDSTSKTVLERAFIPSDVHSFAKVASRNPASSNQPVVEWKHIVPDDFITDLSGYNEFTICNTSDDSDDPVLRIVKGKKEAWASYEGRQCQYGSSDYQAETSDRTASFNFDLLAKVEVCSLEIEKVANNSRCALYTDGNNSIHKPVGLLQKNGQDGRVEFGLITGSYHRNLDGGVIRKTISRLAGNEDTSLDEINLKTGQFLDVDGMIKSLNAIESYGWNGSKYADCNAPGISISAIEGTALNRHCSNWGNPVSEIFYEALRYFAGANAPTGTFINNINKDGSKSETYFVSDLSSVSDWSNIDPINATNYCSRCSIILMSSGSASFDSDIVNLIDGDLPDLDNAQSLIDTTNKVGRVEYLGNDSAPLSRQFIAQDDGNCVPTIVSDLSAVEGICPDSPQVKGSFHVAGLAYHARTTDMRDGSFPTEVNVTTYAIELAESVPAIEFKMLASNSNEGNIVKLIPTCQSKGAGSAESNYLGCSLYNFIVDFANYDEFGNLIDAEYIVFWEDSLWGNDFDLDGAQRIRVCTNLAASCNSLKDGEFKVDQAWVYTAAGFNLRASYAVVGSTSDGLNTDYTLKGGTNVSVSNNPNSPVFGFDTDNNPITRVSKTFTVDTNSEAVELLQKPLYLAAKFGGFNDRNGNDIPDLQEEWDVRNNDSGKLKSDGIPDNYFQVRNPSTLERQLTRVLNLIVERVAAGSNAAVVANRASGNGSIYQAIYYPKINRGDNSVVWAGQLHALFVDEAGLIREDTNDNGLLDGYPYFDDDGNLQPGDFIIDIFYNPDPDVQNTFYQRYALFGTSTDASKIAVPVGAAEDISQLKPIWNAVEQLASIPNSSLISQRNYNDKASTGRYIFTSMEPSVNNCTIAGVSAKCPESVDFTSVNYAQLGGYMGINVLSDTEQKTKAIQLINWVRGIDQPSLRTRQIDMNGDAVINPDGTDTWRLGDIIHSTPLVVERPLENFDQFYGDKTYAAFREKYEHRRRMVYVGSNSGKIHAFNGGWWDATCAGFMTRKNHTDCQLNSEDTPVGAEMWAYVPQNLLGHLRWQAEPEYPHVFYVDGEPQAFDVRLYDNKGATDATNPYGWATILVVPMRQGGADIIVDHDDDGTADKTLRSAIVVLDITDPEQPPKVIAEITDVNLGLTTSLPTLVRNYLPKATSGSGLNDYTQPSANTWHLVFGSGPFPANAAANSSNQNARLYAYDLVNRKLIKNTLPDSQGENSFLTGFTAVDWNLDGSHNAVYFGSVQNSVYDQSGQLLRLKLESDVTQYLAIEEADDLAANTYLATDQPIVAPGVSKLDQNGDRWLFFGTGRYLVDDDRVTGNQQAIYGVIEPRDKDFGFTWDPLDKSDDLLNVSTFEVLSDAGKLVDSTTGNAPLYDGQSLTLQSELAATVANLGGWYRNLTPETVDGGVTRAAGRVLRSPVLFTDQLLFSEYVPSGDQCDVNGRSNLYVLDWSTGTAPLYNALGATTNIEASGDKFEVLDTKVDLGIGEFSGTTVFETSAAITLVKDPAALEALQNGDSGPENFASLFDEGNCVFVQSSTGEMVCRRVFSDPSDAAGRQSWRELEVLF